MLLGFALALFSYLIEIKILYLIKILILYIFTNTLKVLTDFLIF